MPELPEVETIRRQLNEALKGKVIEKVEVLRNRSFDGDPNILAGWKIEEVGRKSKVLEIYFQGKKEIVIVHLKMTGQLVYTGKTQKLKKSPLRHPLRQGYEGQEGSAGQAKSQNDVVRIVGGHPSPDWVNDLPSKHTRVIWSFLDGSKLFFNDMRVFGWMKIITKTQKIKNSKNQIPDVIDKEFTDDYLFNILKSTKKAVKLILLDQDKIGGLGNIYVNDALFLAGIRPDKNADLIKKVEIRKLHKAIVEVVNLGIKYGGASASNYIQVFGLGGTYQDHFMVYKKEGQKCPRCEGVIKKMKLGGRGSFYCPNCQK